MLFDMRILVIFCRFVQAKNIIITNTLIFVVFRHIFMSKNIDFLSICDNIPCVDDNIKTKGELLCLIRGN